MTAPIQEPSPDRALQGFAFARDQLQRRPMPSTSVLCPTWIAANGAFITDDGNIAPAFDELWTGVWIDQNPSYYDDFDNHTVFDIVDNPGGGCGGEDAFGIRLKQNGLYTYHIHALTNDLTSGADHELIFNLRIAQTATPLMPNAIFYPGIGNNNIRLDLQETVEAGNDGQWVGQSSVTTPIFGIAENSTVNTAIVDFFYSNSTTDDTWNFLLWIIRHCDVVWDPYEEDMTNPTVGIPEGTC